MSKNTLRRLLVAGWAVAALACAAPALADGGPGSEQPATVSMNAGGGG